MANFRGFIAIDIPSFPKLLEFENEIKKTGANIRLVEPKNIHITLKFLEYRKLHRKTWRFKISYQLKFFVFVISFILIY